MKYRVRTGRPQAPGEARYDSPEAVSCGVPPKERAASAGRRRTEGQPGAAPRRGNPTPKTTPSASEKRGRGTVGSVCPRCRDAAAGWARAASGAGNRWAAVVAAVRRRGGGRSLGGRSLWSVAEAGGKYGRRQAEEAGVTADGRRTGAWSTVGGRRKRRKSRRRRRQAEEAGNYSTADGTQAEEAGVTADGRRTRGGGYGRRQAEEAEVTATAGGRGGE